MRFDPIERLAGPAAVLAAALLLAPAAQARGQETIQATILSSASSQGETVSCGCKKKELGGIARRATLIKEERARNEAFLLVDAGDFGSHVETEPWMRTEFQWKMMKELGYDVVTLGPNELVEGIGPLRALLATAPEIQVVSANITDRDGEFIWPEFTTVERGGVVFGVTGVTDGSYYSFNLTRGKQKSDDFEFRDIRESLRTVLPRIRGAADVVVVLLHTGSGDAKRVLEGIDGIDVVVVGHAPSYKFVPERVNGTLVINAGNRGQYLNVLDLTLDSEKEITDYTGEARPLGDMVAVDPAFNEKVAAFNTKYDALKPESAEAAGDQ